ncbi:MAG: bifunctional 4-hydroxy-2-oxoglutarate aldolase/2-dehydro-3-deoxy-phosphogluconate aldolase [Oscillospiraceae bacterium]|nr:bifunctional 4-hydroxy-2-oxoglutarate aldolase/2-dehydro-3-deoxy-phosphogluconate aldolase [Oscillospiraceae bacterium]
MDVLKQLGLLGLIPVITIQDPSKAPLLAEALWAGGLRCAEVTFRVEGAAQAIKLMLETKPEMLVGAGTVLTVEQVVEAKEAGAKFIVAPCFNPEVVEYCVDNEIPILPGCITPTEVDSANMMGLEVVKFFPAESFGGLGTIKAIGGPYKRMKFVPTGGINPNNLPSYLASDRVLACGGSWMVDESLINNDDWDEITRRTQEAIAIMLGYQIGHLGINMPNAEEATACADTIANLFGAPTKSGNSSIFVGSKMEVMKEPYLGEHGHLAIKTNSVERAMYYLEQQGATFNMDTAKYENGRLKAIYLNAEYGGYALHLLLK